MADRTGQQFGNYRLMRLLGRGGFAEVYLGEHIRLNTLAAIKVLHAQLTSSDEESFNNEARTIARLVHPHIVRVLDFDIQEGVPFLVMEYASNGTLRQRHPKGEILTLATIVDYVKQVTNALQFAHDEKLIHRDIKPENMLLGRRNEILLSDFGIATVTQSSRYQNTQEVAGTVAYMPPEQIQGKPRPASDQYALGVVVYEWLSGDRPFHGSFTEIATQQMFVPPPSVQEKVPKILPDVEQVVMTALEKDPYRRFASVQAFANALEQASKLERSQVKQAQPSLSTPAVQSAPPVDQPSFTTTPSNAQPAPPWSSTNISVRPSTQFPTPSVISTPPVSSKPPIGTNLYTYRGHPGWVYAVSWSYDNKRIASAGSEGSVQVWDTINGGQLLTYHGHSKRVNAVEWAPDSKRIVSVSNDKTVQVWEVSSGRQLFIYPGHTDWVIAVRWSPDGRRIASGSNDGTVRVLNTEHPQGIQSPLQVYSGKSGVNAVAWSPDGRRIASGSNDKTVLVWDVTNGRQLFVYQGHSKRVNTVVWSPDSRYIASASDDHTVQVWDAAVGTQLFTYHGHSKVVNAISWSPDGRCIASASYKAVQVWDATTGNSVVTYHGHHDWVGSVAWSPDGTRIASSGDDKTVQVWTIA